VQQYPISVSISSGKADLPAIIDPNVILSCPSPCWLFQAIGGWHLQIVKGMCVVEHAQLTQSDLLDFRRQRAGALAGEEPLGLSILA
jgi:hypothetical protein